MHNRIVHPGLQFQQIVADGQCLYRDVTHYLGHGEDVQWLRNLVAARFEAAPIVADGQCLYRAVTYYLGHGEDVQWLRNLVAARLEAAPAEYTALIKAIYPDRTVPEYIAAIRNGSVWADDFEIAELMGLLNQPIVIIGNDGNIMNRDAIEQYGIDNPIFVYYNGIDHYDVLILRDGFNGTTVLRELLEPLNDLREVPPAVVQKVAMVKPMPLPFFDGPVWIKILQNLDVKSLVTCRGVSKAHKNLIDNEFSLQEPIKALRLQIHRQMYANYLNLQEVWRDIKRDQSYQTQRDDALLKNCKIRLITFRDASAYKQAAQEIDFKRQLLLGEPLLLVKYGDEILVAVNLDDYRSLPVMWRLLVDIDAVFKARFPAPNEPAVVLNASEVLPATYAAIIKRAQYIPLHAIAEFIAQNPARCEQIFNDELWREYLVPSYFSDSSEENENCFYLLQLIAMKSSTYFKLVLDFLHKFYSRECADFALREICSPTVGGREYAEILCSHPIWELVQAVKFYDSDQDGEGEKISFKKDMKETYGISAPKARVEQESDDEHDAASSASGSDSEDDEDGDEPVNQCKYQ